MYGKTNVFSMRAFIIVTAPAGATVTATLAGAKDANGSGSCTLTVRKKGVWRVTCSYDGTTKNADIDVNAFNTEFHITFAYTATIKVNAPAGSSVTVSKSGQTSQTLSVPTGASQVTFTVPKKGAWKVSCTYDGTTKSQDTAELAYGGTDTRTFTYTATIKVNAPAGSSVTVSQTGQTSQTLSVPTGASQVTFTVPKKGIWGISCKYDGTTKSQNSASLAYDGTDTRTFVYNCVVTVSSTPGARVTLAKNGTAIGSAQTIASGATSTSFTITTSGSITVTATHNYGTNGAHSVSGTITASYGSSATSGGTASITLKPRYYIFFGESTNYYLISGGFTSNRSNVTQTDGGTVVSHGGWRKITYAIVNGGGNATLATTNAMNLTGFTKIVLRYRTPGNMYYTYFGVISNGQSVYTPTSWPHYVRLAGATAYTSGDWAYAEVPISGAANMFPAINTQGEHDGIEFVDMWVE